MQYEGKLYGKVAGKYIQIDDMENEALKKRIAELEEGLREISQLYDKCVSIYGSPATALYVACEKAGELLSEGGGDD